MTVYRLTKKNYAGIAFSGSRRRGRWHLQGTPMVYAADSPATALLEMLVHVDRFELLKMPFVVFEIRFDPDRHLLRLPSEILPENWREWPWPVTTQGIGTFWHKSRASVLLEVPCAVVPYQSNYLVNVQHPDFSELTVEGPRDFPIDPRLGGVGLA